MWSYFTSCCYHSLHYPCNQIYTVFPNCVNPIFLSFPSLFPPMTMPPPAPSPYCHLSCSLLPSSLRAALIKHGVGGGTESSSWAEEKGSNSTSQDGTVTHNGPAIPSVPPWIPNWKAFTSGSFLIGLPSCNALTHASINTHAETRTNTHVPVYHAQSAGYLRVCVRACVRVAMCVCVVWLVLRLTLLWAFWSAPQARWQPFHFPQHAETRLLS